MKGGANICQKAGRLALWFLFIWQIILYYLRKTIFINQQACAMVFQNSKTLFHTWIYMKPFKKFLQMAGKALHVTVWKQQYTGTTESTEVSRNIYAITYYIPLVLHDSCLEGLHDTVSATSTYLLQYLAWSKFREELCNTWQLFGSISLHDSCKRKCEFAFLGFCLPGFLRSHL